MFKLVGIVMMGIGIMGVIKDWMFRQIRRQKRMEEIISFYRKAVYAIEETQTPLIPFFESIESVESLGNRDSCLTDCVHEIAARLKENRYPKGKSAWQEVMKEQRERWDFSKESFDLLFHSGSAFFGKSQKENLELLRLYIRLFSDCARKEKMAFAEQKKVWIPVGALGGIMLVIMLM